MFEKEARKKALCSTAGFFISALQVPGMIEEPTILSGSLFLTGMVAAGYCVSRVIDDLKKSKMYSDIINSEKYAEYEELYNEYVGDIAKLFKDLGIRGDLEAYFVYRYCLAKGIFSDNCTCKFTTYKNDFDYFTQTMGARVATGAFCCRHCASLLTDIINQADGLAANLCVLRGISAKSLKNSKDYHLVTQLLHEDKKLIVDPTLGNKNTPLDTVAFFYDITEDDSYAFSIDGGYVYRPIPSEYEDEENNRKKKFKLMGYSYANDYSDFLDIYLSTFDKCLVYEGDFECFHNDEKQKIKRLARLNKEITPHGGVLQQIDL